MKHWEVLEENASIVFAGSFNPTIFHPEWFIRKGFVAEWDYNKDSSSDLIVMPDLAQMFLPDEKKLSVQGAKFTLSSNLASNYISLKDLVLATFSVLNETPVTQMGMNLLHKIHIPNDEQWLRFGEKLAPLDYWKKFVSSFDDLDEVKQAQLGLMRLEINLPREDGYAGRILVTISNNDLRNDRILTIAINNHIELEGKGVKAACEALASEWENSLKFSDNLISSILEEDL